MECEVVEVSVHLIAEVYIYSVPMCDLVCVVFSRSPTFTLWLPVNKCIYCVWGNLSNSGSVLIVLQLMKTFVVETSYN